MASIRCPLHLVLLIAILLTILSLLNGSDARAKNSMKLQIPESQRANCLAKLLCGIQAQSVSSPGVVQAYTNQAHLLRKYFQTYSLPDIDDKPTKSKSSAPADEDDDDLDDSVSSDESDDFTVEEPVKKPAPTTRKPGKKPEKKPTKTPEKKKSSLFDTGVPIIEQPTAPAAVAINQQKVKRHWVPIQQELTVRVARQLASKSVRNCNVIEGCGFTFKQIFVSLQEDSNVMGSEAIGALSSASFESPPIAETKVEEFQPPPVKKVTERPTSPTVATTPEPDDELEFEPFSEPAGQIAPAPVATSPLPLPPIVINENEDEVENEDIKIPASGLEDLFLSIDPVLSQDRDHVKKKTRRPVTANTKKDEKKKTKLARPTTAVYSELASYEYQLNTHSRTKGAKTKPQRLNYKTPSAPKLGPKTKKSPSEITSTARTTTTTSTTTPSTQIPIFQLQASKNKKKKPNKNKRPYEFEQSEEDYDDSRDTYDEEEELENPSQNDYGEDLEDVSLDDDDDDNDDEYGGGGGWQSGGGGGKKKKNKNKNKNKNNKNKNKNKNKKGQQQQQGWGQHQPSPPQGWGWQPQYQASKRPFLTEIGGLPLVPTPEPSLPPGLGFFGQSSGWATLYRKAVPEQSTPTTPNEPQQVQQQQQQLPSQPPPPPQGSFGSPPNSTSNIARSEPGSGSSGITAEERYEFQYRPPSPAQDKTPTQHFTGFSITKLASPFTSLFKVINANMRGR